MEDNYINELDKEFKKSRWLRGGPGGKENREMRDVRDMSPSIRTRRSHLIHLGPLTAVFLSTEISSIS